MSSKETDLISNYLDYVGISESPTVFHRWSALATLGAWLGRRYHFPFGHANINCNMYVMLMGDAGSRKSTAIKQASKLIKAAGYTNIAAEKTTKEKFLLDLAGEGDELVSEDILSANLFGAESGEDREILIAADEFNIFVGNGNVEFLSLLGTLWDIDGVFENRVKNSKSIKINNPTITILAGNTPTGFSLAFPAEAIGQGIFSRILLIHGERTGRKITFPAPPCGESTRELMKLLQEIRRVAVGAASLTASAKYLLDKIYQNHSGISDIRFESYSNRRFTHLLKLCLLVSASRLSSEITEQDVLYASTMLTHAEYNMPKALGEFGKAKNSDVSHKLLSILENSTAPIVTFKELWSHLHNDLDSPDALKELVTNLSFADKIMTVKGGLVSKRKAISLDSSKDGTVDFNLLTDEERGGMLL